MLKKTSGSKVTWRGTRNSQLIGEISRMKTAFPFAYLAQHIVLLHIVDLP